MKKTSFDTLQRVNGKPTRFKVNGLYFQEGGYEFGVYKHQVNGRWYVVDLWSGLAIPSVDGFTDGFRTRKEALEMFDRMVENFKAWIVKHEDKYGKYCERFMDLKYESEVI